MVRTPLLTQLERKFMKIKSILMKGRCVALLESNVAQYEMQINGHRKREVEGKKENVNSL